MNNIQLIAKEIQKNMTAIKATKPTLAIVYDSILVVYPKLSSKNYKCIRKVIIEEIASFYETSESKEIESIIKILSRTLKEC